MENNLDDFIQKNGVEVTNEQLDNIMVTDKRDAEIREDVKPDYAYDIYDEPIPGQDVIADRINSQINNINENTAMNSLIIQSAMIKAKNENDETVKSIKKEMSAEEKAAAKKQFVESMLYQQGELYYQQHHHIMDGKTKKGVRKRIERDYDKGRFSNKNYFKEPQGRKVIKRPAVNKMNKENTVPVNVNSFVKM